MWRWRLLVGGGCGRGVDADAVHLGDLALERVGHELVLLHARQPSELLRLHIDLRILSLYRIQCLLIYRYLQQSTLNNNCSTLRIILISITLTGSMLYCNMGMYFYLHTGGPAAMPSHAIQRESTLNTVDRKSYSFTLNLMVRRKQSL